MNNSRLYRVGLYSVFGIVLILMLVGLFSVLLSRGDLVTNFAIVGFALVGACLAGISHIRMRMMFEVLHRKLDQSERVHRGNLAKLEAHVGNMGRELTNSLPRALELPEDAMLARLQGIEREIIANDSFNEARLTQVLHSLNEVSARVVQAEANLESVADEKFQSHERRLADFSDRLGDDLKQREQFRRSNDVYVTKQLEDIRSTQERANYRTSSLISVIKDTRWLSSQFSAINGSLSGLSRAIHQVSESVVEDADSIEHALDRCSNRLEVLAKTQSERLATLEEYLTSSRDWSGEIEALSEKVGQSSDRSENESLQVRRLHADMLATLRETDANFDKSKKDLIEIIDNVGLNISSALAREMKTVATNDLIATTRSSIEAELGELRERSSRVASEVDAVNSTVKGVQSDLGSIGELLASQEPDEKRRWSWTELSRIGDTIETEFGRLSEMSQRFFNATQNKLEYQRSATEELPKDINDYASLLARFGIDSTSAPDIGGWSATVPAISTIVNRILSHPDGPCTTLDVGSGTSTFWSALAMRERGEGKCFALEHSPEYAGALRRMLGQHDLENWVEIVDAPLVDWAPELDYLCDEARLPDKWYETDQLVGEKFDLVFVDGPPGDSGIYSRLPAIEQLWESLTDEAVIVLDDTIRSEERDIVELWTSLDLPGGRIEVVSRLVKSMILRVTR